LCTLGGVLKNTEVCSANFWTTLYAGGLNLTNNWLGYILGNFFTDSSGHPDYCIKFTVKKRSPKKLGYF
jgi:hypothetical protein